ncbi:MAG: response regulator [Gemmatimonadota bacterium]
MNGATRTILVVDDDPYVRTLVAKLLGEEGYNALPAADAWQATDALQKQPVDLIILDLRMPGPVDGEQLLFALRDQGNDVPIIVLSGYVDDDANLFPPDCVHAVLKKPIRVEHFTATVRRVLDEG